MLADMPEIQQPILRVPHPRPTKLSDPFGDFSSRQLAALLATPDKRLGWNALQNLLGPHLPAGTYDEVAYFLPLACDYAWRHPDDAIDLTDAIIGFVSLNYGRLHTDGLADDVSRWLAAWPRSLTQDFQLVRHFGPARMQLVCGILESLVRFKEFAAVGTGFVRGLAERSADSGVASAWLLALARARGDWACRPPDAPEIVRVLTDPDLLRACKQQVVRARVGFDVWRTYWPRTFATLGL